MILKEFYLYPDLVEFNDDVVLPFRNQSRSVCSYLERKLKPIRFETDGFKRVCFIGQKQPSAECVINSSKVLCVPIPFDQERYKLLKPNEVPPLFLEMLQSGFRKCRGQYALPEDELLQFLDEFKDGGHVNRWTFKSKLIKGLKAKAHLDCEVTVDAFTLDLTITRGEQTLFTEQVLKTAPDELAYAPFFKDLKIEPDRLVVTDKFGDTTYELLLEKIGGDG